MEDKLQTTIDKILRLCAQNPDFDSELRKKLNIVTSNETLLIGDERINQIYEYCLVVFYIFTSTFICVLLLVLTVTNNK